MAPLQKNWSTDMSVGVDNLRGCRASYEPVAVLIEHERTQGKYDLTNR